MLTLWLADKFIDAVEDEQDRDDGKITFQFIHDTGKRDIHSHHEGFVDHNKFTLHIVVIPAYRPVTDEGFPVFVIYMLNGHLSSVVQCLQKFRRKIQFIHVARAQILFCHLRCLLSKAYGQISYRTLRLIDLDDVDVRKIQMITQVNRLDSASVVKKFRHT